MDENIPRALELLQEAAYEGNPHAQFHLGVMYEYGRGVPQNFTHAASLYAKAASATGPRIPDAMYYLGLLYAQGRGEKQSFTNAMELFQRAADDSLPGGAGHAPAMYALGQMHANGQGTPIDYTMALAWLRRAAQKKDPRISGVAAQVAKEMEEFLQQVETRVQEQEHALGTPIKVTIGAIE